MIMVNQTLQDVGLCHVDMNKQYVFMCVSYIVYVFVQDRGTKVFWIWNLECVHILQVIYVYSFGFRSAI